MCDKEHKELLNALGEDCVRGKMNSGNGTDKFGFSALPGSNRDTDGSFDSVGFDGIWWSATENGSGYAWYRYMASNLDGVHESSNDKGYGFSVVCVRD